MNAHESPWVVSNIKLAGVLTRAPALRPVLFRLARLAFEKKRIPETFTVRDLSYTDIAELNHFFGAIGSPNPDGSYCATMMPWMKKPEFWAPSFKFFGLVREEKEDLNVFADRLMLAHPKLKRQIYCAVRSTPINRFLAKPKNRELWRTLLLGVAKERLSGFTEPITLSQLGSRIFNDSKILRSGPLRQQLYYLLLVDSGRDIGERELLATYGITDNPYTSLVTVFAPFVFTNDRGEEFDFPLRLYKCGIAATLNAETVAHIKSVRWCHKERILVTSENAAPFARYVAAKRPCLYTEGYPNFAVQALLDCLSEDRVEAEHAGDADFDGLRIAGMIGKLLPVRRCYAAEILEHPDDVPGIPLTEDEFNRTKTLVTTFPNMPYADAIRRIVERRCWYEQEAFPL